MIIALRIIFQKSYLEWFLFLRLMVDEKVDQLELMSLQKLLKNWELEKYCWTASIVMVETTFALYWTNSPL